MLISSFDAEALRWFFMDVEGTVLRSSTGPLLDKIKFGLPNSIQQSGDSKMTDRILDDMERMRGIEDLLKRIGPVHSKILERYFGQTISRMVAFEPYASVACLTQEARDYVGKNDERSILVALRALSARSLASTGETVKEDRREVTKLILAAERLTTSACAAFAKIRNQYGRNFGRKK